MKTCTSLQALAAGLLLSVASASGAILITEVNSNATGGDFFELYNTGVSSVDIGGWRWTDDAITFDNGNVFATGTTIGAGATLVVINSASVDNFKIAWGLDSGVNVLAVGTTGLGQGDGVVVYDGSGVLQTAFNYGAAGDNITAFDTALISPFTRTGGSVSAGGHAGVAAGAATAATSAVWDVVSGESSPRYTFAQAGVLGGFNHSAGAVSGIGSPGVVSAVPEPASYAALLGAGVLGFVLCRRNRSLKTV
jgi:hypothetical protein